MMDEMECMKIQHELEAERLKQKQWQVAMEQLRETKEHAEREHQKYLEQIKEAACNARSSTTQDMLDWFKTQTDKLHKVGGGPDRPESEEEEKLRLEKEARDKEVKELQEQQEHIANRLAALNNQDTQTKNSQELLLEQLRSSMASKDTHTKTSQELLLEQLKDTLGGKKEEDPNKMLLKALITNQNKTAGEGGTNTLKLALINSIMGVEGNSMAEWLAGLNRQEEGESEIAKLALLGEGELAQKPPKARSGMLDKATTNIQQKQVWPQQNLGEDWADEEVEFKQIKFEHLVAGETRTIETCTDPAEILGRLRLLRRIAYMKLRGYEWPLIRKMYAAILTSIETKEYSWESNFDRFETILYRKMWSDTRTHHDNRNPERDVAGRKRFCRDYNKVEGCPKNSPHAAWFGCGPTAVKRTVYHFCAACLIRDKTTEGAP